MYQFREIPYAYIKYESVDRVPLHRAIPYAYIIYQSVDHVPLHRAIPYAYINYQDVDHVPFYGQYLMRILTIKMSTMYHFMGNTLCVNAIAAVDHYQSSFSRQQHTTLGSI